MIKDVSIEGLRDGQHYPTAERSGKRNLPTGQAVSADSPNKCSIKFFW
jgi:hypothetical protein